MRPAKVRGSVVSEMGSRSQTIVFVHIARSGKRATEFSNSEKFAGDVARARKLGLKPTLVDMADLETGDACGA